MVTHVPENRVKGFKFQAVGVPAVLPALRLKRDESAAAEVFMAHLIGMTYKGLPVCSLADGRPILTQLSAEKVFELFGPPTHYFLGSSDPCWLLSQAEFNRFKSEAHPAQSASEDDNQPPGGGWLSPHRAANSNRNLGHTYPSLCGGGMLTQHIVLS